MAESKPVDIELYRAVQQAMSNKSPDTLYHYTDASGFLGIVQSKKLWATDLRFVNDSQELQYGTQLIKDAVHRKLRAGGLPDEQQILGHLSVPAAGMLNFARYAVSFCEKQDQLSQWRAYGPGGGFAVGFAFEGKRKLALSVPGVIGAPALVGDARAAAAGRCSAQHHKESDFAQH